MVYALPTLYNILKQKSSFFAKKYSDLLVFLHLAVYFYLFFSGKLGETEYERNFSEKGVPINRLVAYKQ